MKFTGRLLLSALLVSIAACSAPSRVAVVEHKTVDSRLEAEKIGGTHIRIAEPGDSLHGIAFANGLNVNKLAAWNELSDTSKLRIGQKIRLTQPIGFVNKPKRSPKPIERNPVTAKPSIHSAEAAKSSKQGKSALPTAPKPQTEQSIAKSKVRWIWPTKGKVIAGFSPSGGRQGIDIGGENGQAVKSSAAGEVVYVGNGLKGYGNLVIVKHNDEYLSAYAHNKETFVQEGQRVLSGYRIASLGKDKQQRDVLHFQIRRDGKPVDPRRYLPNI